MGDYSHLHHLHLWGLERVEGHRDVEAHAFSNGRYKVRIEPHDGKDHSHDEPTPHSLHLHAEDDHLDPDDKKASKAGGAEVGYTAGSTAGSTADSSSAGEEEAREEEAGEDEAEVST
mmetsp:Transcript_18681/g.25236  ORF Transcript_18681/g.25236 Transcript_18681/m.25236 type:complete len:117 (+) Transcript_18681:980-1330(+)